MNRFILTRWTLERHFSDTTLALKRGDRRSLHGEALGNYVVRTGIVRAKPCVFSEVRKLQCTNCSVFQASVWQQNLLRPSLGARRRDRTDGTNGTDEGRGWQQAEVRSQKPVASKPANRTDGVRTAGIRRQARRVCQAACLTRGRVRRHAGRVRSPVARDGVRRAWMRKRRGVSGDEAKADGGRIAPHRGAATPAVGPRFNIAPTQAGGAWPAASYYD